MGEVLVGKKNGAGKTEIGQEMHRIYNGVHMFTTHSVCLWNDKKWIKCSLFTYYNILENNSTFL